MVEQDVRDPPPQSGDITQRVDLELFADYCQFYLQDERAEGGLADSWNEEASINRLAVAPGVFAVGTARNFTVPVVVEVRQRKPEDSLDGWDHVVETGLEVLSGRIVVAGCTDYFPDAVRIPVVPGQYRSRTYYAGLGTVGRNGTDGEDHYKVVLWPGGPQPPVVVKRWHPDEHGP